MFYLNRLKFTVNRPSPAVNCQWICRIKCELVPSHKPYSVSMAMQRANETGISIEQEGALRRPST